MVIVQEILRSGIKLTRLNDNAKCGDIIEVLDFKKSSSFKKMLISYFNSKKQDTPKGIQVLIIKDGMITKSIKVIWITLSRVLKMKDEDINEDSHIKELWEDFKQDFII